MDTLNPGRGVETVSKNTDETQTSAASSTVTVHGDTLPEQANCLLTRTAVYRVRS